MPEKKIVEAHGSFARQRCIECKTLYPGNLMKQAVSRYEVPRCLASQCNGLVKPDIVFFGEMLPEEFHRNRFLPSAADLCIVMGTSLTVQPFASLPGLCPMGIPRILINLERVGGLGSRADDVLILGDCDAGVRRLVTALGWGSELEALYKDVHPEKMVSDEDHERVQKTAFEEVNDMINKLTKEVNETLKITNEHTARV